MSLLNTAIASMNLPFQGDLSQTCCDAKSSADRLVHLRIDGGCSCMYCECT
jgi:hypothetical protein